MNTRRILLIILGLSVLSMSPVAVADTIVYRYNQMFSGTVAPGPTTPWLTATFDQLTTGTDNTVRLTLSTINLVVGEFLGRDGFYFNFNPDKEVRDLEFTWVSGNDPDWINLKENKFKADGDGLYDILLDWKSNPGNRLDPQQTVIYDISLPDEELFAGDFYFLSEPDGGHGPFYSAAHVQGIGPGDESTWIRPAGKGVDLETPEPGTLLLLGGGLVALAVIMRKTNG